MDTQEINSLWRIVDPLTVHDAAALVAGIDPYRARFNDSTGWMPDEIEAEQRNGWLHVSFVALRNAINAGTLPATLCHDARMQGWDEWPNAGESIRHLNVDDGSLPEGFDSGVIFRTEPNWAKTTVKVSDVREWLSATGIRTGFFFPNATDALEYLDSSHPRYAPKLAAAVRAWQAVTDPNGKTPKQALKKWLNEHAAGFNLTKDDGTPNAEGIEQASSVANWKPDGGAPKTPAG